MKASLVLRLETARGSREAPIKVERSFVNLQEAVKQAFAGELSGQGPFKMSCGEHGISGDVDVMELADGATLTVVCAAMGEADEASRGILRERVSFAPHPKTLTRAGDYEYFAAQGHHPFAFALAELIDNALRACSRRAAPGGRPHRIQVTLAASAGRGMACVADTGCGMTAKQLQEWAVMNLSVQDREAAAPPAGAAGDQENSTAAHANADRKHISSELSYFGVGSKNAGFYIGADIKVCTKAAGSRSVHELRLEAAALEARYSGQQAVYEEDMIHRPPGSAETMTPEEHAFAPLIRKLLRQEEEAEAAATLPPAGSGQPYNGSSFTRVLITCLKPAILEQMQEQLEDAAAAAAAANAAAATQPDCPQLCRDLAHLYHYYLHGPGGNRDRAATQGLPRLADGAPAPDGSQAGQQNAEGGPAREQAQNLPNCRQALEGDSSLPDISVRFVKDMQVLWVQRLADVTDDMETRLLRAQQAELEFALDVPGRGRVHAVLWYFPFMHERETVPQLPGLDALQAGGGSAGTAQAGAVSQMALSQVLSQHASMLAATQPQDDDFDNSASSALPLLAQLPVPVFEAFWQGRLIPGTQVSSLPVLDAVRTKRSGSAKYELPDEVFSRLRGALFFGPSFLVTRNKLMFRDNLHQLLSAATPVDRSLPRKLRDWLVDCHRSLDKTTRFEKLAPTSTQAAMRRRHGEALTVFERISIGDGSLQKGDTVLLSTRPHMVGSVVFFGVPRVTKDEGLHAGGFLLFKPLPVEVFGSSVVQKWSLRRLERRIGERELEEALHRERQRLPATLAVQPPRWSGQYPVDVPSGTSIPEIRVCILSGANKKITKALLAGNRSSLSVVQRLWEASAAAGQAAAPKEKSGRKTRRKQRGQPQQSAGEEQAACVAPPSADADAGPAFNTLLSENTVSQAFREEFTMPALHGKLLRAGEYLLEHLAVPSADDERPIAIRTRISVMPGAPASFTLRGPGRLQAGVQPLLLQEPLAELQLQLQDSHGNHTQLPELQPDQSDVQPKWSFQPDEGSCLADAGSIAVYWDSLERNDKGWVVRGLHLVPAAGSDAGMLWSGSCRSAGSAQLASSCGGSSMGTHGPLPQQLEHSACEDAAACPELAGSLTVEIAGIGSASMPLRLRPGPPCTLKLLSPHPWEAAAEGKAPSCDVDDDAEDPVPSAMLTQRPPELAPPVSDSCAAAVLPSGALLPAVSVAAFDRWGQQTAPCDHFPYHLLARCPLLMPEVSEHHFAASGVALLEGLCTAKAARAAGGDGRAELELSVAFPSEGSFAAAAGASAQPLLKALSIQPSTSPETLVVLFQGRQLELLEGDEREQAHLEEAADDGQDNIPLCVLPGVTAGSCVSGLSVAALDESGQPAASTLKGRLSCSWARGSKSVSLGSEPVPLQPLQVPENAAERLLGWLRFTSDSLALEAAIQVRAVPGAPKAWATSISASAVQDWTSQSDSTSDVQCGVPFTVLVEALDQYQNRCKAEDCSPLMPPLFRAEAGAGSEGGDGEEPTRLEVAVHSPGSWQASRDQQACFFKTQLVVQAPAQEFRLHVSDQGGPNGASLLVPDSTVLRLLPGPAARLAVEGPQALLCPVGGRLGSIRVHLCDAFGNRTTRPDFEVALESAAHAVDGSGAAVPVFASGSNRVKLKKGVAMLRNVRLQPEDGVQGSFSLQISSASRSVVVEPAGLTVEVKPLNAVTDIAILADALPQEVAAGSSTTVWVMLETDDRQPVPQNVAESALSVSISDPDGVAMPCRLLPPGDADAPAAAADAACSFALQTPRLERSGRHTLAAEWRESRAELASATADEAEDKRGDARRASCLRSPALQLPVLAAPLAGAAVEAEAVDGEPVPVSNGKLLQERTIAQGLAVQLQDSFRNPVAAAGTRIRLTLEHADASAPAPQHLPLLDLPDREECCPGQEVVLETNSAGRAFVGRVAIKQGSGSAADTVSCSAAGPSLEHDTRMANLCLILRVFRDGDWEIVWQRHILFSDSAAALQVVQQLLQRRSAMERELQQLRESVATLQKTVEGEEELHSQAQEQASALQRQLSSLRGEPGMQQLSSAEEVGAFRRHLQEAQTSGAGAADDAVVGGWDCRFGQERHGITTALQRCLAVKEVEVVGVVAQLGTVADPAIAAALAAAFRSMLCTLVVKTFEDAQKLREVLKQERRPIPDILPLSGVAGLRGSFEHAKATLKAAPPLAQRLLSEACNDTDPPLLLPLPHQQVLMSNRGKGEQAAARTGRALAMLDWPQGCLGFAVNLVRPLSPGLRATVLHSTCGKVLLFDTLENAQAYRELIVQDMRGSISDLLTADGHRVSARGVIHGSSFRVPAIQDAIARWGSGRCGGSHAEQLEQQVMLLQQLQGVLEERQRAASAAQQAGEQLARLQESSAPQSERLQDKMAQVTRRIDELSGVDGASSSAAARHGEAMGDAAGSSRARRKRHRGQGSAAEVQAEEDWSGAAGEGKQPGEDTQAAQGRPGGRRKKRLNALAQA